jgi:restriction endonuclease S subunit
MKLSNNIINNNNEYIKNYNEMKQSLLDAVPKNNMVELNTICNILSPPLPNSVPKNLIGVIRNGLTAGTVNIIKENTILSNNSHYIELNNNSPIKYIYYMIKHNESKLIELANLTPQPNLNKSNLLSLKIPDLDTPNQQQLTLYYEDFDANIEKYKTINENIMNKNIIDIVLKLNHI